MVMVIDDAALRVVSALVGMYDVMEHRVTLIELLSKERQPLPVRALALFVVAVLCPRRSPFPYTLSLRLKSQLSTHMMTDRRWR
jgi:hypothetical protein